MEEGDTRGFVAETVASAAKFRAYLIGEIKRLAAADGGRAPGRLAFERATGVKTHQWRGVYWAKWNDAVLEAGCQPNEYQQRFDSEQVLRHVVDAARHFGHWPSDAEMALYRRQRLGVPSDKTISGHFPGKAARAAAVRQLAATDATMADILSMLPEEVKEFDKSAALGGGEEIRGKVYLIKSGGNYRIGRSGNVERRFKQVAVALPDRMTIEHTISTDDEVGIETYWLRRFDRFRIRSDADWFKLGPAEVRAFKRRKFM